MEIQADTKKIYECGNQIIKLASELNEELDAIFKRIEGVNSSTYAWVGESANKYVEIVRNDKLQYYALKDALYNRGKYLVDIANLLDETLNNVKGKINDKVNI